MANIINWLVSLVVLTTTTCSKAAILTAEVKLVSDSRYGVKMDAGVLKLSQAGRDQPVIINGTLKLTPAWSPKVSFMVHSYGSILQSCNPSSPLFNFDDQLTNVSFMATATNGSGNGLIINESVKGMMLFGAQSVIGRPMVVIGFSDSKTVAQPICGLIGLISEIPKDFADECPLCPTSGSPSDLTIGRFLISACLLLLLSLRLPVWTQ